MLGENGGDCVSDDASSSPLKPRGRPLGRRLSRRRLSSNVLMDTLEADLKLAVPKTSNQAHRTSVPRKNVQKYVRTC
jgi:hypothetical protein